jgi:hypothetical protein
MTTELDDYFPLDPEPTGLVFDDEQRAALSDLRRAWSDPADPVGELDAGESAFDAVAAMSASEFSEFLAARDRELEGLEPLVGDVEVDTYMRLTVPGSVEKPELVYGADYEREAKGDEPVAPEAPVATPTFDPVKPFGDL